MQFHLPSLQATEAFAARVAAIIRVPSVVYLQGDLGAGKTTFVRAWLSALGFNGRVKSPTYTLVEPYNIQGTDYYHFDLYRLGSPLELEAIGIQDYMHANSICLVEWPEKGQGVLPEADVTISLQIDAKNQLADGRICILNTQHAALKQKIAQLSV